MDGFELKYQLDTDENREFLKKIVRNCSALDTSFLRQEGVLIIWVKMGFR